MHVIFAANDDHIASITRERLTKGKLKYDMGKLQLKT